MKKKLAVLTATALSLTILATSAFAATNNMTTATSITTAGAQKILQSNFATMPTTSGEAGNFFVKGIVGDDFLAKIIANSPILTQAEKDQLSAVAKEIEPLQAQINTLMQSATTQTTDSADTNGQNHFSREITLDDATKQKVKDIRAQIQTKLDSVKDILAKAASQDIGMMGGKILSGEGFGINFDKGHNGKMGNEMFKSITVDQVKKLLDNNTVLTQAEKDQVLSVYTAITPLITQAMDLQTKYFAETDATKKTALKTQLEDVKKQIEDKTSAIKDLMNKILPQGLQKMGKSFILSDNNLKKLLDENTTLTQAEKDQLLAASKDVQSIMTQIQTLKKSITDKTNVDAATKTQLDALQKQLEDKYASVKDIIAKLVPTSNTLPSAGQHVKGFDGGKMFDMFSSDILNKILDSTTLSATDKATVQKVVTEIAPLQQQLTDLATQYKAATDATVKTNLQTQMKAIQKQISDKVASVADIIKTLMPTMNGGNRMFKTENGVPSTQSTTKAQGTFKTNTTTTTANWL